MKREEVERWLKRVHNEAESITRSVSDYQVCQWIRQIKELVKEVAGYMDNTK